MKNFNHFDSIVKGIEPIPELERDEDTRSPLEVFMSFLPKVSEWELTRRNVIFALQDRIRGTELELAKELVGFANGTDSSESHQPCLHCVKVGRFWYDLDRQRFHCQQCGFSEELFGLVEKVRGVSFEEAFDIIATRVGFDYAVDSIAPQNTEQEDTKPATKGVGATVNLPTNFSESLNNGVNSP